MEISQRIHFWSSRWGNTVEHSIESEWPEELTDEMRRLGDRQENLQSEDQGLKKISNEKAPGSSLNRLIYRKGLVSREIF